MKKVIVSSLVLLSSLALVACGTEDSGTKESQVSEAAYPVTVTNFARTEATAAWKETAQVFEKKPERVLANTQPAAELLLHLGLKDRIVGVGAVFGEPDKSVATEFSELKSLGKEYISQEVALSVDPDLIFGRGGLFDSAEWGVGTVPAINEMGINTYVLGSSVTGGTFASIYDDITNLGKIFDAEEAADKFSGELKERQAVIADKLSSIKEERDFSILFITDPQEVAPYAAKDETFFNDIFTMVKLNNIYQEVEGEISLERLIEDDPEVLIIPDWRTTGGIGPTEIKEALYSNPKLSSLQAIKNKQIFAVDYNYMFGYGYIALDGMEILAKEMHPDLFK